MSESGDAILGTVLDGRYRVEAVLGAAHAGGTVFRGRDATLGSTVVVRCPGITEGLAGSALDAALDRFVSEAATLARISQASTDVEKLLASGIAERSDGERVPYTVFEWLAGRSLERHIEERTSGGSISEALVILEPAARALSITHGMGAAHRDVRPANLWLAELNGRTSLKVAAFGLATRVGAGDTAFAPEYGAPEHFKRSYGAIGPATDVYGLALCIIEMVTGKRALVGADAGDLYLATSDLAKRPTLRARGAHISDAVETVLQRALAVDPKRRWQSARELWDALIHAVPELSPAPPSVRVTKTSDRPPGIGAPSRPGMKAVDRADSGPATSPPGLAELARAASASGSAAAAGTPSAPSVIAEDARLSDSLRVGAPARAREREEEEARKRAGGDKTGTWAWLAVGVVGVIAAVAVGVKVGVSDGPAKPTATATPSASTGASGPSKTSIPPPSSSAPAPRNAPSASSEAAVVVQPFLADMVKVPAAKFTMGSDHDGKPEKPAHPVTLTHAFYIDRTEVRADAYAGCVADGACTPNRVHSGDIVESSWGCNSDKDRPKHPANCVDRVQAEKYCAFAKKRLPTEAEWEFAARGTDNRDFPWGNRAPSACSTAILSGMSGACGDRKGTWEVGTTADGKGPFGALDMAGNVWEWVADGYEAYGPADAGALVDPKVALSAAPTARGVLRGGSWDYAITSAKVTYRLPFNALHGNVSIGFRCARDAE